MIDLQDARRVLTTTAREQRIAREELAREIRWACTELRRRIREDRRPTGGRWYGRHETPRTP